MKLKLEPEQEIGVQDLVNHPTLGLFWGVGIGKTSTVLEALKRLFKKKKLHGVLVIAPKKVAIDTWPDEIAKWEDFKDFNPILLRGKKRSELLWEPHKNNERNISHSERYMYETCRTKCP